MSQTVHPLAFKTLCLAMNPENTMFQLLKTVIKNPVGAIHINTSSCDFISFNITLNEKVISNATYN
jgi:hypothetical protein